MTQPMRLQVPEGATKRGTHVIGDYELCQQLTRFKYILGLEPKIPVTAPTFGTAWHNCLEVYYWGRAILETKERCLEHLPLKYEGLFNEHWEGDCAAIAEIAGVESLEPIRIADEETEQQADYPRHLEIFQKMFPAYQRDVIEQELGYHQLYLANGCPAIESHFEIPLGGAWTTTGRIDRVVTRQAGGHQLFYVRDYKTSAFGWLRNLEQDSRLSAQFSCYYRGFEELFGDRPVAVLVDVAEKPRRNMILEKWTPKFEVIPVTRTRAQINDFLLDAEAVLAEIDDKIERENNGEAVRWRKVRNNACINQYQRECPYLKFCTSPDRPIDLFGLDDMFTLRREDPA